MEFTGAQLEYLDHLGIDVWVPREQLLAQSAVPNQVSDQAVTPPVNDGAYQAPPVNAIQNIRQATSPAAQSVNPSAQQPMSSEQQVPVNTAVQANQAMPNAASANAETMPDVGAGASVNSSPLNSAPAYPGGDLSSLQPKNAEPVQQVNLEKAPEFHIQFWCYSTGLWLVSGNVNLEPEHHKLVHNIAHFIQGKKRKPRHVGIFSWPMLDSPNIDQGPEVAAKHLKDHIHRLQEISAVKKVVAFSDSDDWFSHLNPVKLDFTVDEVLHSASNKKSLWQSLLAHQIIE